LRKHVLAGGAAAVLALTVIGSGLASAASQQLPSSDGIEGCAVGPSSLSSCSYTPTVPGGFIGSPDVLITVSGITHNADGTTSPYQVSIKPNGSQEGCALWTPASSGTAGEYANVTGVSLTSEGLDGVGVIGQPYPSQSPKQLTSC
jgi:hypothetical protein